MVKPPSQLVGAGILEVNDGVLITIEEIFRKKLARPMHQASIKHLCFRIDAGVVKPREQSSRARPIKTLIVKTDSYFHTGCPAHLKTTRLTSNAETC